ncbi:hypothetical protein GWK47_006129 [Chionoecetes opilio]|uniref:Uncharacterized protein n=1 Tax=Chionoecetes opilio TaxID=41210 RepID=A0A8J4Y601_CHIOP|nr:hypothetical protein GWK47_006129 [Chionoecetes opilio]
MAPAASRLKLVAIRGALHHALESHSPHVIRHTDSKSSIQALRDTQPQDRHSLLTSTSSSGPATGCTWLQNHPQLGSQYVALVATKQLTELQNQPLALPSPTTAVLPSLSQTLLKIKFCLARLVPPATRGHSRPIITSASWYAAATSLPPTSPRTHPIPPHVRDRLHRLRLGFPCFEEIRQGDVDITCDRCQVTPLCTPTLPPEVQGNVPPQGTPPTSSAARTSRCRRRCCCGN